jgi:hypothetical protein
MPRDDRPWERKADPDGEVSRPAASVIGFAFVLVNIVIFAIWGLSNSTLLIGLLVGVIVIVVLSKLVVANQKPAQGRPRNLR